MYADVTGEKIGTIGLLAQVVVNDDWAVEATTKKVILKR